MRKEVIPPERIPTPTLIPGWDSLKLSVQARIEAEMNTEWWRGYWAGREAERIESQN